MYFQVSFQVFLCFAYKVIVVQYFRSKWHQALKLSHTYVGFFPFSFCLVSAYVRAMLTFISILNLWHTTLVFLAQGA